MSSDSYDPEWDGLKSYTAAIEAKRLRGDTHDWVNRNKEKTMNTNANAVPTVDEQGKIDATPLRAIGGGTEIERFMTSSVSMWRKQRDKIAEMQIAYEADRFRVAESYKRKLQALNNEAEDAVRDIDRAHEAKLAEAKRMLDALAALRDS
jgi:hypothetical protein